MGCIKNPRVLAVLSGTIGALIGAFISLVVDSSLFEISVNGFFSFVFGVSLMLIGSMILFRVLPQPGQAVNAVRMFIIGFSILVIFSGLFCFFLERDWITVLKPNSKIPMYIVLGTSLCFALTFSIVDLLNQGVFYSVSPSFPNDFQAFAPSALAPVTMKRRNTREWPDPLSRLRSPQLKCL
jgi:hypothetical protein